MQKKKEKSENAVNIHTKKANHSSEQCVWLQDRANLKYLGLSSIFVPLSAATTPPPESCASLSALSSLGFFVRGLRIRQVTFRMGSDLSRAREKNRKEEK